MESVTTYANKTRTRYIRWLWILIFPLLAIVFWRTALPTATVHYSPEGREELRYVWNVKDRIYRGRFAPGASVSDKGFLSPDSDFFMEFSWRSEKGRWHCISITPTWPNTHIFLNAEGEVDRHEGSGTDADRLKQCEWDSAKP
ncbi:MULTISPECIES: hypothetical protein [unclassified Pseudomonas]|jgi:hypothetical protein|uniref:hypothetical protein n=1 Tax=unclassified Pseudomonas TaxID=196821 RepID=UPI001EE6746E|nr:MULTISPECIES: hypothetical protein [unclassified Pseudomonas]